MRFAVERLFADVRNAARNLRKTPGFTATVIITLMLGIGANTALFSIIDRLLLRPLPYPHGEQLMMIHESLPSLNESRAFASPANWLDWQRDSKSFESLAAWSAQAITLTGEGEATRLNAQLVSEEFFPALRATPALGRAFTSDEDRSGGPNVVILSYGLWRGRFGGDPAIIGKKIELDDNSYEVIGVMAAEFHFVDSDTDCWIPYRLSRQTNWRATAGRFINVVGRLKPALTQAQAQAELENIAQRLAETYTFNRDTSVTVVSLREVLSGKVKTALIVLFTAVSALILIACFNVAGMLLARAASRRQEIAVRTSLGATRASIVRQVLVESLILALAGGFAGTAFAQFTVEGVLAFTPGDLIRIAEPAVDRWELLYAIALSCVTACIFGLAPALWVRKASSVESLRGIGRSVTSATDSGRMRQALVAGQVAITLVLLTGSGLFVRSLFKLVGANTGLNARNVLTMYVQPSEQRYNARQRVEFFAQIADRLRTQPGVEAVAAASSVPVVGPDPATVAHIRGTPPIFDHQDLNAGLRPQDLSSIGLTSPGGLLAHARVVTPGYFKTLGIPILEGRDFESADQLPNAPAVFIVNEALASRYLAGKNPLDASISVLMDAKNPYGQIVGVVGNVIEGSLRKGPEPTAFYVAGNGAGGDFGQGMTIFIRADNALSQAKSAIQAIHDIDRNQPIAQVKMLEDAVGESASRERLTAMLSTAFAVTALLLAALGVYGLLAYSVAERTKEIGIRMALGARPGSVVHMVLKRGLKLIAVGASIGLAGSVVASRFIENLLFGVSGDDPLTLASVLALVFSVGTIAVLIPAYRASKVDPMVALRED